MASVTQSPISKVTLLFKLTRLMGDRLKRLGFVTAATSYSITQNTDHPVDAAELEAHKITAWRVFNPYLY